MSNQTLAQSYASPFVAGGYDFLSRQVFAPVGGLHALRERAMVLFDVRPGATVLELGCGTGMITQKLLHRGAVVTSVDWSPAMLERAAHNAPGARFERAEITAYRPTAQHDLVLFSFVLHELDEADRGAALRLARGAINARGAVAVLDHAFPRRGLVPRTLSAFVRAFEPASTRAWIDGGFDRELAAAGLARTATQHLAGGMAVAFLARP